MSSLPLCSPSGSTVPCDRRAAVAQMDGRQVLGMGGLGVCIHPQLQPRAGGRSPPGSDVCGFPLHRVGSTLAGCQPCWSHFGGNWDLLHMSKMVRRPAGSGPGLAGKETRSWKRRLGSERHKWINWEEEAAGEVTAGSLLLWSVWKSHRCVHCPCCWATQFEREACALGPQFANLCHKSCKKKKVLPLT